MAAAPPLREGRAGGVPNSQHEHEHLQDHLQDHLYDRQHHHDDHDSKGIA